MSIDENIDIAFYNIGYMFLIASNRFSNLIKQVIENSYKIVDAFTSDDVYVFFNKCEIPISLRGVTFIDNKNMYYNKATHTFFSKNTTHEVQKNIPYLALELNGFQEKYDLTSWISNIKYSTEEIPSIKQLIGTWSLESKILIDITKDYDVNVITDEGDVVSIKLNNTISELTPVSEVSELTPVAEVRTVAEVTPKAELTPVIQVSPAEIEIKDVNHGLWIRKPIKTSEPINNYGSYFAIEEFLSGDYTVG